MGTSESTVNTLLIPCDCLGHLNISCKSKRCTWRCEMLECGTDTHEHKIMPPLYESRNSDFSDDSQEHRRYDSRSSRASVLSNESFATQEPLNSLRHFPTQISTNIQDGEPNGYRTICCILVRCSTLLIILIIIQFIITSLI